MNKQTLFKLLVYGVLQWVLLNIVIFVISLVAGVKDDAEMTAPPPLGFVIVAVIMVLMAYFFARRLEPVSRKQAVMIGLFWSGLTTLFMLVTLFANDTRNIFLSSWTAYLIFIAQVIGAAFVGVKNPKVISALSR